MKKKFFFFVPQAILITTTSITDAQQAKVHRVGIIMQGGPYYEAIDGLRAGSQKLRL